MFLAGGAGLVEKAVGEFGAEGGESDAGAGAGVAHAHDAHGAGEGVGGDQFEQGVDVLPVFNTNREFGEGVGAGEDILDNPVEDVEGRGAGKVVNGDDDRLA